MWDSVDHLFNATLEKERRTLGERHPLTSLTTYRLGSALAIQGDRAGALGMFRQAIQLGFDDAAKLAQDPDLTH